MRQNKPFGVPDDYSECPYCRRDFRKCDHSYEQADKEYLLRQKRRVLSGKQSNDIARVVKVEGINLFLWHDGRVTWSDD